MAAKAHKELFRLPKRGGTLNINIKGQQTVAAQKEGSSEPSTLWADRGRLSHLRPLQESNNQVVPAH